mmetsp:Transcript_6511/g.23211  ORF Transcript_6511/g.23211 Transcript_6511/m.23211 type:complete len:224 (-) Transcript_6511:2540-3211(-)
MRADVSSRGGSSAGCTRRSSGGTRTRKGTSSGARDLGRRVGDTVLLPGAGPTPRDDVLGRTGSAACGCSDDLRLAAARSGVPGRTLPGDSVVGRRSSARTRSRTSSTAARVHPAAWRSVLAASASNADRHDCSGCCSGNSSAMKQASCCRWRRRRNMSARAALPPCTTPFSTCCARAAIHGPGRSAPAPRCRHSPTARSASAVHMRTRCCCARASLMRHCEAR